MTKEETEAWIVRLVEGGSAFPFSSLSWDLQGTLVLGLASLVVDSWMATYSAGSRLDVGPLAKAWLDEKIKPESGEVSA